MNTPEIHPRPPIVWQALPNRQRQQLLTLLGQWVLRQWPATPRPGSASKQRRGGRRDPK